MKADARFSLFLKAFRSPAFTTAGGVRKALGEIIKQMSKINKNKIKNILKKYQIRGGAGFQGRSDLVNHLILFNGSADGTVAGNLHNWRRVT